MLASGRRGIEIQGESQRKDTTQTEKERRIAPKHCALQWSLSQRATVKVRLCVFDQLMTWRDKLIGQIWESGKHNKLHKESKSALVQSLNPRDLSPVIWDGMRFDRSGIRCRAEKSSPLKEHGTIDSPGIRESSKHSWNGLNNDSSLTGILEVKLFDVRWSPVPSNAVFPIISFPSAAAATVFPSRSPCFICSHLSVTLWSAVS